MDYEKEIRNLKRLVHCLRESLSGGCCPSTIIECVIGQPYIITGSNDTVTGLTNGSTNVQCDDFVGKRITLFRGNVSNPGQDPLDGSAFFTKLLSADNFDVSQEFVTGEMVIIKAEV